MASIAKLSADLVANTSTFEDGMQSATNASSKFVTSFNKDIASTAKSLNGLAGNILGINSALGSLATIGSLTFLSKEALDSADAVSKLADKLGLTTDQVQAYQFAAKQSGVDTQELQTAFNYLNREIADGKVPYSNLSSALNDIANRMANSTTGSQRAQLAYEAFGKAGVNLIPMLLNGAQGLKDFADQAQATGSILSSDTITAAVEFKNQIDTLGTVIAKNFQTGLLDGFIKDSGDIKDIYTDPNFVNGVQHLGEAFGTLADGMLKVVGLAEKTSTVLATLGIAAGVDLGLVDPDVYNEVLKGAQDKLNGTPTAAAKPIRAPNAPSGSGSILLGDDKASQLDKFTSSLENQTAAIGESQKELAEEKAVIDATNAAQTDYNNGIRDTNTLTPEETANIQQLAGRFYDLKEAQQQAEKYNQEFKTGFEDAAASVINGSKSIGDALKELVVQFAALIEKELILQPLADSIFGTKGTGGFGGLLAGLGTSSFPGGLAQIANNAGAYLGLNPTYGPPVPSYDSGTDYVPRDMTANIHQGEAVLNPQDAAAWRAGGGNTTVINAPGASKSDITQLKALVMALAGPGRVEDRISDAQKRGKL